MTFTSLTFLIFFPMVFLLHWLFRNRHWQNTILVLASYFFYGWWDWRFCALMLASSLIDYVLGICVYRSADRLRKKIAITFSIICNLGLLGFFKYFNFFADNLVKVFGELGWTVHPIIQSIVLPVGISFYTFQTLSYTIDVYRGKLKPTDNLIDYLAFVSFFPQLVAGPIERATNLIPQFSQLRKFDEAVAIAGCHLILWGFFKKLVIADRLASVVDIAYASPGEAPGITLAIATVFFAFQIYCDFSAYSDIAIGTGKLFGISLMRNFDSPYFSNSVTEFWRRWHISLSTWFRDYVFIPLGGSRGSQTRTRINLLITFVLSGLWHGAAWQFVVWGAINGFAIIVEKSIAPVVTHVSSTATRVLKTMSTFAIICFGWIFFRANHLNEALLIVGKIVAIPFTELSYSGFVEGIQFHYRIASCTFALSVFVLLEWLGRAQGTPFARASRWPLPVRWASYSLVIWITLKFMLTSRLNPFIYFAF